ncbi:hypothetical protein RJ639_002100 [Escallonia herrerae]|uniref:Sm protein G n=1 Tax=Escallonia herrerae TaxID=1293975 RepID=A0AA88XB73_9ASTE|nr:hypothetical protein RJ639_002100 [Escallonia herrerae]
MNRQWSKRVKRWCSAKGGERVNKRYHRQGTRHHDDGLEKVNRRQRWLAMLCQMWVWWVAMSSSSSSSFSSDPDAKHNLRERHGCELEGLGSLKPGGERESRAAAEATSSTTGDQRQIESEGLLPEGLAKGFTMSRSGQPPDLKKIEAPWFLRPAPQRKPESTKSSLLKLNANRMVVGTLRGFDQFMNLVIDNTVEVNGNENNDIGMVVSFTIPTFLCSDNESSVSKMRTAAKAMLSEETVWSLLKRSSLLPDPNECRSALLCFERISAMIRSIEKQYIRTLISQMTKVEFTAGNPRLQSLLIRK